MLIQRNRILVGSLIAVAVQSSAWAAGERVECHINGRPNETIRVSLGENNKIVPVYHHGEAIIIANVEGTLLSGPLSDSVTSDDSVKMTYVRSTQVTVVEVATTADSAKLAINLRTGNGSYLYQDHGSGNGNHSYKLSCSRQ